RMLSANSSTRRRPRTAIDTSPAIVTPRGQGRVVLRVFTSPDSLPWLTLWSRSRRTQGDGEGDVDPGRHRHPRIVVVEPERKRTTRKYGLATHFLTVACPAVCWRPHKRGIAEEGGALCRPVGGWYRQRDVSDPPPRARAWCSSWM